MPESTYVIDVKNLNESFNGVQAVVNASLQVKMAKSTVFMALTAVAKPPLFGCYAA